MRTPPSSDFSITENGSGRIRPGTPFCVEFLSPLFIHSYTTARRGSKRELVCRSLPDQTAPTIIFFSLYPSPRATVYPKRSRTKSFTIHSRPCTRRPPRLPPPLPQFFLRHDCEVRADQCEVRVNNSTRFFLIFTLEGGLPTLVINDKFLRRTGDFCPLECNRFADLTQLPFPQTPSFLESFNHLGDLHAMFSPRKDEAADCWYIHSAGDT